MKSIRIIFILILLFLQTKILSQNYTISGTIVDIKTGEHLLSANIYDANTLKGTISNFYGFYSLKLPAGSIKLTYSYTGYQSQVIEFTLQKDTIINPALDPITLLQEVIVSSKVHNIAKNNQMGMIEMSAMQTKQLPVFMGESDILKTIQLLPGVKGGTEGTSGMYVRGGGPDQNLILLDGVPVYNATHLFGFFSVFNSDAIQNFTLLKGGFPARYGERLSSVLDIKMKEGNNKKFCGEASVGIISSKLTLEGPIKNENTSFLISGRRTYLDLIPYLYLKSTGSKEIGGYYFYDINAKINHSFSAKSRLYYSFYLGLDKFFAESNYTNSTSNFSSGWGNNIQAIRWNYVISDNLFLNTTATYSNYTFFIKVEDIQKEIQINTNTSVKYSSGIRDWSGKLDFDFVPSTSHYIRFGSNITSHTFNPGVSVINFNSSDINQTNIDTSVGNFKVHAIEFYSYAEDDIEISSNLKLNIGLHYSFFYVKRTPYHSLQPRLSARYMLTNDLSIKASVVQMKQYIHLLSTSNIGLPTDLWVPVTNRIKPMEAWQFALGFAYDINNKYNVSVEGYYKPMYNLIEYKEGASFFSINNSWENKVESGRGWGKGIEFLLNRTSGKITGWIGYTLSYADRKFENISFGQTFPYKYDRRHDIGIAINYNPSEKFDMGITWAYGSGNAFTLAEEQYPSADILISGGSNYADMIEYFPKRNAYRMPVTTGWILGLIFININIKE
jgi:outer membrane receptor for ferrienterochelin and colicin